MTYNIFVKCDVCESIIDLKWQVGYLSKSTFKVNCGKCKTLIEGTLLANNPGIAYEIKNAREIEAKVDLNCDYIIPISGEIITEKMRVGEEQFRPTPFINISMMVGIEKFSIFNRRYLQSIEIIEKSKSKCDRINELYINKEYKYMKKMLIEDFKVKRKKWNNQIILEEKYYTDLNFYYSFVNIQPYMNLREKLFNNYKKIKSSYKAEYKKMLCFLKDDIDKYERRIRDVLNLFIEKYNSFIPILLLEYVGENKRQELFKKYAITTVNYEEIRDMYLRIYENVVEVSIIFNMLNNIMYRGDYSKIDNTINNKKKDILEYKEMSKGNKIKYLSTEEMFNLLIPKFDKDIRNAIGHEDIEYNSFRQTLKYDDKEIYLMEYVYNIWKCYEKCLLMYRLILEIKMDILQEKNA